MAFVGELRISGLPARPSVRMAGRIPIPVQASAVSTSVKYVKKPEAGEPLFLRVYTKGEGPPTNAHIYSQDVEVQDIREEQQGFRLQDNGFELVKLEVPNIDWVNKAEVQQVYYPIVAELIKAVTGASRVQLLEHRMRQGRVKTADTIPKEDGFPDVMQPATGLHVDFTLEAGPELLAQALPGEAEKLSKTPFAIIQVWRPLEGPVNESPLTFVDVRSVAPDDYLHARLDLPGSTSSTLFLKYNPDHKFFFAKDMETSEAFVFNCYDSRKGVARFCPHCSFTDPSTPSDAPERKSVEIRAFAFWEHEPQQEPSKEY